MIKTEKTEHFDARHVEYDKIKHYAAFYVDILCFFHGKKVEKCIFIQTWLDHLALMT